MKLDRLDAHDRLESLQSTQSLDISECCQDLIRKRPFGDYPFYIFAHARIDDNGVDKRLIWQPRLTKPKAQTNSMLFKAYPGKDEIEVIWMIPDRHMWDSFKKGNLTESQVVVESIYAFEHDRTKLEQPSENDLSDEQIDSIYRSMSAQIGFKKAGGILI